jgi:hypothetical protein
MGTERAMFKFHNFSLTAWLWLWILFAAASARAQQALTWEQVRTRFEQSNPTLLADKLSVDESRAQEITAFLRPNPTFTLSADGTQIAPEKGIWRPFAGTFESPSISYLHERQHKRELRLESAKKATLIAESSHANLQGTLPHASWEFPSDFYDLSETGGTSAQRTSCFRAMRIPYSP